MPHAYENKGSKSGSQKGTFIGNPSATHIHLVGRNDHLKLQNNDRKRYNIHWRPSAKNLVDRQKLNQAKKAGKGDAYLAQFSETLAEIDHLRAAWDEMSAMNDNGVPACKAWLRSYLVDYHGVNPSKLR
ncbi:hypothetical protein [Rhabdonatronobacter sediminivivens]|uniref:hypothetical protein n=1 Tax=Rhabdonatronobacter sediminivivens TaxID=2743469 RepID=UPI0015CFACA7|nr:hypothetical protein [Rhabdonatronobacter sediminivivens]